MAKDSLCAIVTGSASGLGAATAEILARSGARLVINYSSSQKEAEATAELCRKAGAAEVLVAQGDVSKDDDCRKIVAAASGWGRLDILVNNAGTTKHVAHADLDGLSAEDFQRLYGVNTIGPFQMVRAARSLLEAGVEGFGAAVGRGQRVLGRRHQRRRLVDRLCREQGRAQHHDAVAVARTRAADPRQHGVPRLYRHALVHQGPRRGRAKQVRDSVVAKVPLKVASSAEDIAQLVCFLAMPASSNMTGEVVRMDAGMHLIT